MALTKCSECGHVVSDKAAKCPNCGNAINSKPTPTTDDVEISSVAEEKMSNNGTIWKVILSSIITLFVGIGIGWYFGNNAGNRKMQIVENTAKDSLATDNQKMEEEKITAENSSSSNENQQVDEPKPSPAEVEEKIICGMSMSSIDYDVMLDYCEDHNSRIGLIVESIMEGASEMEEQMMMQTLNEDFPYIDSFMSKLGEERELMSEIQKSHATSIAREFKRMYAKLKEREYYE